MTTAIGNQFSRPFERLFCRFIRCFALLLATYIAVLPPSAFANVSLFQAAESGDETRVLELLENVRQQRLDFNQCWNAESCTSGAYSLGSLDEYCWDQEHGFLSALHIAAQRGHTKVVQLLLDAGFDPNIPDRYAGDKFGPIYSAAYGGHGDVIRVLHNAGAKLRSEDQHCPPSDAMAPLHVAAREGRTMAISALIDLGVDPAPRDINGVTPLHEAARKGHRDATAMLLSAGVDPDVPTQAGYTPLHYAVEGTSTLAVPVLLRAGADPNQPDRSGRFPLLLSTKVNDADAVEVLLDFGAFVNVVDEHGNTALHHATSERSMNIVNLLLCHGADPNAVNDLGTTPISFASSRNWTTITTVLETGCTGLQRPNE